MPPDAWRAAIWSATACWPESAPSPSAITLSVAQILPDDAPGADIHVADFGVTDLADRETNVALARVEEGDLAAHGVLAEGIEMRSVSKEHSVVCRVFPVAPAVEDGEDNRAAIEDGVGRGGERGGGGASRWTEDA